MARLQYVPTAFLTALLRVKIDDDLGDGIEVGHGLTITNNRDYIAGLLTPYFKEVVGHLESTSILTAPAIVFMFGAAPAPELGMPNYFLTKLEDFLRRTQGLLNGLWLRKDNSADFELGFVEAPHRANFSRITSNYLAMASTCADGGFRTEAFSRDDLDQVGHLIKSRFLSDPVASRPVMPAATRIERALYLVQAARTQQDLGLKVAFYCMCLEALLSTSSTELAHKLSERIAYFLGADGEARRAIYDRMKEAYAVRSTVLHGDSVGKKVSSRLEEASIFCDSTLRSVLTIILSSEEIGKVFASTSEKLEAWLRDLTLGIVHSPQVSWKGSGGA